MSDNKFVQFYNGRTKLHYKVLTGVHTWQIVDTQPAPFAGIEFHSKKNKIDRYADKSDSNDYAKNSDENPFSFF